MGLYERDKGKEMDIFEQQEMSKSQTQVRDKLKEWYHWLVSHVPEPIKERASIVFKASKDKIMGLYERIKGKEPEEQHEESSNPLEPETRINLIENQTRVRTYHVTGSLNHDISNLILDTICPVIKM